MHESSFDAIIENTFCNLTSVIQIIDFFLSERITKYILKEGHKRQGEVAKRICKLQNSRKKIQLGNFILLQRKSYCVWTKQIHHS